MRVTTDELVRKLLEHIINREGAGFGGDLTVEKDLEQHVAQLFRQLSVVLLIDRFKHFIGLFQQIRLQ